MGTWGVRLYQDDIAQDVRDSFKDQLHRGKTGKEITEELLSAYADVIQDVDESSVFWLALADTQWELGRLLPEVAEKAREILESGSDLLRWQENEKQRKARKKVLDELYQKLNTPQPPEKKVSQYRLYQCPWKIGDVFSYPIECDLAKEKGLAGRYFLLQKVGEAIWHPGHVVPVMYVKITADDRLPQTAEEFDQLEYVQMSFFTFFPMSDEFRPIGKFGSQAEFLQVVEESKKKYVFNDFGMLTIYRALMDITSKRKIPQKLQYIGTFKGIQPPADEFIPKLEGNTPILWLGKRDDALDVALLRCYNKYNLRARTS